LTIVVVLGMTLWYPRLNPVVGRGGTNQEMNSGNGTVKSHFGFMFGYHNVPLLGLGTIMSRYSVLTRAPERGALV